MRRSCLVLLVAVAATDTFAEDLVQAASIERPIEAGVTMALENDLFSLTDKSDRWYTNGLHVAWHFKPGAGPIGTPALEASGRWLLADKCMKDTPGDSPERCPVRVTYGLGQSIYTPRELGDPQPQPLDRPWAGWFYGGAGIAHTHGNRHQIVAYKMGPTGPLSLAKQAQAYVHRYISRSPKPLGWGNQLRPRLGVQLSYLSTHYYDVGRTFGANLSWGGTVGNLRTMARAGLGLAWSPTQDELRRPQPGTLDEGEFLLPDFDTTGQTPFESLRRTVFYANLQAAVVPYNAFIDGETYAGRAQIHAIKQVWTTTLGVTVPVRWGSEARHKIGFAYKVRSPEFRVPGTSSGKDSLQRWGVLSWTWVNR